MSKAAAEVAEETRDDVRIRFTEDRIVLDHNRKPIQRFKAGQVVELTEASARHWLTRGAARLVNAGGLAPDDGGAAFETVKPEGEELVAAIVGAIDALDPEEDFTRMGDPAVPALAKALGYDITGAERDLAADRWRETKPGKQAAAGK